MSNSNIKFFLYLGFPNSQISLHLSVPNNKVFLNLYVPKKTNFHQFCCPRKLTIKIQIPGCREHQSWVKFGFQGHQNFGNSVYVCSVIVESSDKLQLYQCYYLQNCTKFECTSYYRQFNGQEVKTNTNTLFPVTFKRKKLFIIN